MLVCMHRLPAIVATVAAAAALAAMPTLARAQADALQRCRSLPEAAARLACYDAIVVPAAAPPAPPAMPAATAAVPAPAAFGLPDKARAAEPEAIEAQVAAGFSGWGPNERIRLDNGQVWLVTDGSTGDVRPGQRKVKVRRGALGSYFLEFEGLNRSPRVRRVE